MKKKDLKCVDKRDEVFALFNKHFKIGWSYNVFEILKNETHYFIEYEIYMIVGDRQIHLTNMSASFTIEEYQKINEENFNTFIMAGVARNIISGFQLIKSFKEQDKKIEDEKETDPKQLLQN